jgi:hypothetical protein
MHLLALGSHRITRNVHPTLWWHRESAGKGRRLQTRHDQEKES